MKNIKLETDCYDKFIFKGSLALECYFDLDENGNNYIELFNEFNKKLKEYRMLSVKDEKSKEAIVQELKSIIIQLGTENFIIYKDGDVEYNTYKKRRRDEK